MHERVGDDCEPPPPDEVEAAGRAAGVLRFAGDIADVDEAEALPAARFGRGPEGRDRRRRRFGVFEVGVETADVPGDVRVDGGDEAGDRGQLVGAVVHPRDKEDVKKIVALCNRERIPLYVYGGGSSVTLGVKPSKGGVTLVMNTHMNKLLHINETNQTATVQAGMMGPAYENALNNAPTLF
ncbi:MAG: FAD-binding oxidoreductase, partial [Candidatus Aminicenantes bacterium]|nr:FAD-binding oxidoreductase [Candidatus Aminicenantes bacterium]